MSNNELSRLQLVLPTEILIYVFKYLPANSLIRCRQVCERWKYIIDSLDKSIIWRRYLIKDYKDIYKTAQRKATRHLSYYNLYRSLSLWSKLNQARETLDEFASASGISEEVKNVKILRDGIIGVHQRSSIVYYDLETLLPSERSPINGDYLRYVEDDHTLLILGTNLHLFVIRKIVYDPTHDNNAMFNNVKAFKLTRNQIFFVNLDDELHVCDCSEPELSSRMICQTDDSVMCLSFTNTLHVLTYERNIFSLNGQQLSFTCTLDETTNLLHLLYKYRFLGSIDWRVYFNWMFIFNHTVPRGPLQDIIVVKPYGKIIFVGSKWGVLRIYYDPFKSEEIDLYAATPVRQYNFMERSDCPVLSFCPILQIDVMELEDGHTVVVAMPKKVAVLQFTHNFKRTASSAMLPYSDIQKVKILKINECSSEGSIN